LQGRHPRANRRTLIDPIPTVLSQVTAACAGFIASSGSGACDLDDSDHNNMTRPEFSGESAAWISITQP
jgi:hypothetical protein